MKNISGSATLCGIVAALIVGFTGLNAAVAAKVESGMKLRIVGGIGTATRYTRLEEPFWTRELPKLSGGRFNAEILPFDRAGVPGQDMLRLMQLGVVPFGTALFSHMVAQDPELGAPDLAGLNPDMATMRKTVAAFRPYFEKALRERHGIEVLGLYVYPAQVVFCKKPLASLSDLAGRRIRVSGPSAADFVEALGGIPVVTGFSEVIANMHTGNTECAVTGTMSGNAIGLHEITTHIHSMAITWGLTLFGANRAAWSALPPELQALLRRELPKLETAIWANAELESAMGLACNVGAASCSGGRKGKMQEVHATSEDERRRKEIFSSRVLPRWVQRCGPSCAQLWNQTIAPVAGVRASAK